VQSSAEDVLETSRGSVILTLDNQLFGTATSIGEWAWSLYGNCRNRRPYLIKDQMTIIIFAFSVVNIHLIHP